MPGREQRMLRMKLMRRRNIYRIDGGIGAKFLGRGIGSAGEIRDKALPRCLPRIGRRDQGQATIAGKCRKHQAESAAEADNAELQCRPANAAQGPLRLDKIAFRGLS